ncbi:MAG: SIMPL domain-containing protein [Bacteroidota bacterium]|uniref:SIMPL domain-containing protein n=1 Tax=Flagellimonas profundi TaxID=2915620 RepID=A0ABS3FGR0_9FLAO|nr:SIMPL domain-containing protein [Allomuricauda profundi]MBO0342358.1 SIMPL domain-containing protein [Allomuricauda profundi]MEC7770936.1 SIMPL domain-containing protein [Bacteroidota bacterium]
MRKAIIFIVTVLFSTTIFAQTKNFLDTPYLETQARVDTMVTPDKIYLNIIIQEKDTKGRVSVEEQENQMAERFKAMGIDVDEQLVIKDASSNFKKYFLRQKEVLKSKQYSLLVYSGKELGEVMMALEQLDIANTSIEKTEYSKIDELELELKTRAVKKAMQKAEALTKPLGQKVGMAIHIADNSQYYPRYNQAPMMEMKAVSADMGQAQPLDIDFEKIKVETNVNVKFALSN